MGVAMVRRTLDGARAATLAACEAVGPSLVGVVHDGRPVDGAELLWALAGCESAFGTMAEFVRHEAAYMPGGRYAREPHMRDAWRRWGVLAASSFGPFQILYIVAWELGFRGRPWELCDPMICAGWAVSFVGHRVQTDPAGRSRVASARDVFDAYNSGSYRDQNVPSGYVERGIRYLEDGRPR